MGMFDSVWIFCPDCGEKVEFQTKAGDCHLKDYRENKVPLLLAGDVLGSTANCEGCGKRVQAALGPGMPSSVAMMGIHPEPESEDDES